MLITKIFINDTEIDTILIHNTGKCTSSDGDEYEYKVKGFDGNDLIPKKIYHRRSKGYRPLLSKALKLLDKYNISEKTLKIEVI
jgi:hypothetical protein